MAIEYDTNTEVLEAFQEMMDDDNLKEFDPIRVNNLKFKVVVKTKTAGEDGDLVTCGGNPSEAKKISPLHRIFIDADYIIVVDDYEWRESNATRKQALLHRALMSIELDITDTGDVKHKKRKTDVNEYRMTVSRYGLYEDSLETFSMTLMKAAEASHSDVAKSLGVKKDEDNPPEVTNPGVSEEEENEDDEVQPSRSTRKKKKAAVAEDDGDSDEEDQSLPDTSDVTDAPSRAHDEDDDEETPPQKRVRRSTKTLVESE